jgi:SAM-dependent methyltransferase
LWDGAGGTHDARDAAVTGVAKSEVFQSLCRAFFDQIQNDLKDQADALLFLDLACGAGVVTDIAISVFVAPLPKELSLFGVDYSSSAAHQFSSKFQASGAVANGVVADALALPFRSASIDVAFSQFGLEYAGVGAVMNAGRLIAPKGKIMCLTHCRNGAIEVECRENFRLADMILASEVFGCGRRIFAEPEDLQAPQKLGKTLQDLHAAANASPASAGKRLLMRLGSDLNRLAARRTAFDPREALGWLDANAAEISMYRDRMQSMIGAALDAAQIGDVVECWKAEGLKVEEPLAVTMDGVSEPSAWRLSARRG